MTRQFIELKKRTTVRFSIAAATAFLVTGCGTVQPLIGEPQSYHAAAGPAMCENFGSETRCSRLDPSRVTRELDRFSRSAQVGVRGW